MKDECERECDCGWSMAAGIENAYVGCPSRDKRMEISVVVATDQDMVRPAEEMVPVLNDAVLPPTKEAEVGTCLGLEIPIDG
jgi:hypothetical protein